MLIESDRLVLRQWTENDASDLFRYASDPRVSEMALWPCHTSEEMSRRIIRNYFAKNNETFAMELKQTGEVIGCIGLVPVGDEHYPVVDNEREVGYWIGFPYWGQGLTTEALKALLKYFKNQFRLQSILLTTDVRNIGSQRVAEKCGFRQIDQYRFDGIESLVYCLKL